MGHSPKPRNTAVVKNSLLSLSITNTNAKGFGVGRVNDFVLLVDGGLTGDTLEVQVVKVKSRYGYAKLLRIITPAPHRIESPCPVSTQCGGCQFQHCDYKGQLLIKKQIVTDALTRVGGLTNPPVRDVLGMESPTRYRNKGVFPVVPAQNDDGFAIGMYAARSHRIVEINDCLLQHPAAIRVLFVVKDYLRQHKITPYDEVEHKGQMRQIMVRTTWATGEIMVVLVANADTLPGLDDLIQVTKEKAGVTTLLLSTHKTRSNAVLGDDFRVLSGKGYIEERIGGVRYRISAPSFFQVNSTQVKVLYDTALTMAGDTTHLLDAHVGAGGITLYAAARANHQGRALHVTGVDIVAPAITNAMENAALNHITNTRFITGAAEEVIPDLLTNGLKPDVVFLDPPRRGCELPLLEALITAQIQKIVYISCDPATLARDVKILCNRGYILEIVQPVDMFPMTGHVEVVALLRRADT